MKKDQAKVEIDKHLKGKGLKALIEYRHVANILSKAYAGFETQQHEILKIANNVLYFDDNSDYRTALYDILTLLTGEEYTAKPDTYIEE